MTRPDRTRLDSAAAIAVATVCLSALTQAAPTEADGVLLERALTSFTRRASEYQTVRYLRAATLSGKHAAWLQAEVALEPGVGFSYRILDEGGSERTRDRVLRGVLDAERDTVDNWELSALTSRNYVFASGADAAGPGLRRIRVTPKREDARLVDGVLTLTSEGRPVSLEGRLAKAPSFWVRSVTVIRRFAVIDGLTLPVAVESLADVRFVGPSAFSMEYDYRMVDGVRVSDASGSASASAGPSMRLLELHASFKRGN